MAFEEDDPSLNSPNKESKKNVGKEDESDGADMKNLLGYLN